MPLFETQCDVCGRIRERYEPKYTKKNPPCQECGGKTQRLYSVPQFHDFNRIMGTSYTQPFVSNNIRKDGKPVVINGHAELAAECKRAGVVHVPEKQNRVG